MLEALSGSARRRSPINPGPEWSTDKPHSISRIQAVLSQPSHDEIREGIAVLAKHAARNSACRRAAQTFSARYDNEFVPAFLAIWNDVAAWPLTPISISGFRANTWPSGWRCPAFCTAGGIRRFRVRPVISISTWLHSPEVLTSQPYLERLDNPTPMTKMIMADVFKKHEPHASATARRGEATCAAPMRSRRGSTKRLTSAALATLLDGLMTDISIASGEIWMAADPVGQPVSLEEKIRGGDKKIKGALMLDTLRQADAEALGARLAKRISGKRGRRVSRIVPVSGTERRLNHDSTCRPWRKKLRCV